MAEETPIRTRFQRWLNGSEDPLALSESLDWLKTKLTSLAVTAAAMSSPSVNAVEFIPSPNGGRLGGGQSKDAKPLILLAPHRNGPLASSPPQGEGTEALHSTALTSPIPFQQKYLAFHAPLGLLEGAWLQGVTQGASNAKPLNLHLFAAYLALIGKDETDSPAFAYRSLLMAQGIDLPPPSSFGFAQNPALGDAALNFACLQWALGLHASEFSLECLGFSLAYLASSSPWRLVGLTAENRQHRWKAMAEQCQLALKSTQKNDLRIQQGYALYQQEEQAYLAELAAYSESEPSLAEQVAGLFKAKCVHARGYHRKVYLGGKCLEDRLQANPFDSTGFLQAFAQSHYAQTINNTRPFDRLTAFGGPMFGVFTPAELALISRWLDAGAPLAQASASSDSKIQFTEIPDKPLEAKALSLFSFRQPQSRQLFLKLVQNQRDAETFQLAQARLARIFKLSSRKISLRGSLARQFFDYSPAALAERIARIHGEAVAKHRPLQGKPRLNREDYVYLLSQFAPAVLVDGSWLQNQGFATSQASRLHRLLLKIYGEELGVGRVEQNHPHIYRELMQKLGTNLAELHSPEFANNPLFLNAAFDLPVYFLAISLFPQTYLAETLGLNLAIELSGLGAGYLRMIEELNYWEIDSHIVSLHLSIDNLASGHAALAVEAIQIYLEQIRAVGGASAQQQAWRRVWAGYLSLEVAAKPLQWALAGALIKRSLTRWLTRGRRQPVNL